MRKLLWSHRQRWLDVSDSTRRILKSLVIASSVILLFWLLLNGLTPKARIDSCPSFTSAAPDTLVPEEIAAANYQKTERIRHTQEPMNVPEPFTLRWRIGINVPDDDPSFFFWPTPRPGWYVNWSSFAVRDSETTDPSLGMEFVPMVRLRPNGLKPNLAKISDLARTHPGQVWLIGNEPDVRWQDDATPEEYACLYHFAYQTIKAADASASVAIGGISQATPLRLRYLDQVLESYRSQFKQEMPVDIWNIHTFVLREEAGSWGVEIPPGLEGAQDGKLWEVEDHDDLALVEAQVWLMRRWMAARGQRQKPLYITEYGILMPESAGFSQGRVVDFMVGSFDLFRSLQDPELGYSADNDRLVQRWSWFSTRDHLYPTGDLFKSDGSQLPPMRVISGYLRAHAE